MNDLTNDLINEFTNVFLYYRDMEPHTGIEEISKNPYRAGWCNLFSIIRLPGDDLIRITVHSKDTGQFKGQEFSLPVVADIGSLTREDWDHVSAALESRFGSWIKDSHYQGIFDMTVRVVLTAGQHTTRFEIVNTGLETEWKDKVHDLFIKDDYKNIGKIRMYPVLDDIVLYLLNECIPRFDSGKVIEMMDTFMTYARIDTPDVWNAPEQVQISHAVSRYANATIARYIDTDRPYGSLPKIVVFPPDDTLEILYELGTRILSHTWRYGKEQNGLLRLSIYAGLCCLRFCEACKYRNTADYLKNFHSQFRQKIKNEHNHRQKEYYKHIIQYYKMIQYR